MIESIKTQRDDIVGFRTDGTASEVDMIPLFTQLTEKLQLHQKLQLLIEYVAPQPFCTTCKAA